MKALSIEPVNGPYKIVKVSGSILSALAKAGYPNSQILGNNFGSLGNGNGSFWVKEGI